MLPINQTPAAKICLTAGGALIHQGKVLLVKHAKLGIWLVPGGHLESGESPAQAAQREFWEETSLRVVVAGQNDVQDSTGESEYEPGPMLVNRHWVCEANYLHRTQDQPLSEADKTKWSRGCEQHYNFMYLMKLADPSQDPEPKRNIEETDGIRWFTQSEVAQLETRENIKLELEYAFKYQADFH